MFPKHVGFVPSKPFADWLNMRYQELGGDGEDEHLLGVNPAMRLTYEIGWDLGDGSVRRLYRYRRQITETKRGGQYATVHVDTFARHIVEDACDRAKPGLFYELYPEFQHERDVYLEPDAWCPFCNSYVTPVDGLCPWCVCEHGHLFREVGISEDGYVCLACSAKEHRERQSKRTQPDLEAAA